MFWTQLILCSWAILSKLNVVVLRQTGHFFDKNNWEVASTMPLVVDCCSWCCFKRPFEDGAVHVCDRSLQLESFRLTAYFCKTVYSLSVFMCYWDFICVLVKISVDLDWLMRLNIKLLIPLIVNSYSSRTRRIWADIYNQRGSRPSWLLSAHIRQVREEYLF